MKMINYPDAPAFKSWLTSAFGTALVFAFAAATSSVWVPEALAYDVARAGSSDLHAIASKEQALAPYVKPGAPARLLSPSAYEVSAGDRLALELELGIHSAGLTMVSLSTDSGLNLEGQQHYQLQDTKQVVMPLELTVDSAALAYIHIHVEHRSVTGQTTARALAVAIDSRSSILPLQRKAVMPKPYVEMQATEVIR